MVARSACVIESSVGVDSYLLLPCSILLPSAAASHCSFNGTLMAYGQTGAGKTYSMASIAADAIGMIPRAVAEVFQHIEQVCF